MHPRVQKRPFSHGPRQGEADQGPREPGAGAVSALRLVKRNHAMSCGTPRQTEATLCPRAGGGLPHLDLRPHHARGRLQTARSGASACPPRPGHGWQLCHAMLSRPPPPPRPAPHCPAARSAVSRCLGHLLGSLTQGRRANIAAECSAAARSCLPGDLAAARLGMEVSVGDTRRWNLLFPGHR